MATTNILRFNTDLANLESDAAFNADAMRTGGLVAGVAPSNFHNKLFLQMNSVVAALAQSLVSKGYTIEDGSAGTPGHDFNALVAALNNIVTAADVPTNSYIQRLNRLNVTKNNSTVILDQNDVNSIYTVGPTGSGAQKIFAGLDAIPAGALYAQLSVEAYVQNGGDNEARANAQFLYNDANDYLYGEVESSGYGPIGRIHRGHNTILIPLDANRKFKVKWTKVFTAGAIFIELVAVGYIK